MTRPCSCTPDPTSAPFRPGADCALCWGWHFRPTVRAAWGGNPAECAPEPGARRVLPAARDPRAVPSAPAACVPCAPVPAAITASPTPAPIATAAPPAILFCSHYLERDGAPTQLLNLVTRLRHVRPTVFSWHDGPLRKSYEDAGVRVAVGLKPDVAGFDLVVANTTASAPAVRAALAAGVPVVWLVHEATPDWTHGHNPGELAELMPRCFAVVFPSAACRDAYAHLKPANPQVIPTLIPPVPVVDRAAARAALGWGDEFVALTFGRDEPRKGQQDARAAVADLPGVRLVTAAGHADPHGLMAAADLYVCTSRAETFPLSTQEAAAHGVPVVTTPAGLRSGASGDVYQPGDVQGLRSLIEKHRDNPTRGGRQPRPGYHRTLGWYEDLFRAAAGRLPRTASAVRVVYHVAGMGVHWQAVVAEQLDQLRAAGLTRVLCTHVGVGLPDLMRLARERGVELTLCSSDRDVKQYERPGVRLVYRLAQAGDGPVLYLHSKGVTRSPTAESHYHDWRRLMMREVVAGWRERLADIEAGYDAAGVNWWADPQGHFSGNIWVASAAWLRTLPDPDRHFRDRFSCERWVGAVPGCKARSLLCSDKKFWAEDRGLLGALLRG